MPKLILIDGDRKKEYILKEGITSIGRDSNNDISLNDKQASRCHAKISNSKGKVSIIDLDSSNGTIINNDKVTGKVLEDNDEIVIGNTRFTYLSGKSSNKEIKNSASSRIKEKVKKTGALDKSVQKDQSYEAIHLSEINVRYLTVISKAPLFDSLTGDELKYLTSFINKRTFLAGDLIFSEGSVGDSIYIIISGQVEITKRTSKGKKTRVAIFERGSVFGEMALFDNNPRSATAAAISKTEVLYINDRDFNNLGEIYPKVALKVIKRLARTISLRLRRVSAKYVDFVDEIY